jgi:hypothetical protein
MSFLGDLDAPVSRFAALGLWMDYIRLNRVSLPNLFELTVGSITLGSKPSSLVYKGIKEIGLFMGQYPATRHILESFVVKCWQSMEPLSSLNLPSTKAGETIPTLSILLAGKFHEMSAISDDIQEREFLRLFMLVPSTPNSAGQLAGWPVRILMDRLYIITTAQHSAQSPLKNLPLLFTPAELEALNVLSDTKRQLVESFSRSTNLTISFALECLSQNHWVLEDAQKAFQILKSKRKFPKNAFKANNQ